LERFYGHNTNGEPNTNVIGFEIPPSVSSDSFFGNADSPWQGVEVPESVLKIWGLDEHLEYSFCFFGSRAGVSDDRETIYEITGDTENSVVLQTSNNTQDMACVDHVRPNDNGEIFIRVSAGDNNDNIYGFYY